MTDPLTGNAQINAVLEEIYRLQETQVPQIGEFFEQRFIENPNFDYSKVDERTNRFYADKAMALDIAKGQFCHHLVRVMKATNIVEAGTSYGASALFLAAGLSENLAAEPERSGIIHGSEWEEDKVVKANAYFARAGVDHLIDLRAGDIMETLKDIDGPIDLMLLDIWEPAQTSVVKMLDSRLRPGSVILADNSAYTFLYSDYFDYISQNGFSTMTLPFEGGLEFTVKL